MQSGRRDPRCRCGPRMGEAGQVLNGMISHVDWFTTFLAAAGEPDIADKLRAGAELDGHSYKVHLDGFNQLDYLNGEVEESPRFYFFYVTDDDLAALRYQNFKFVFLEQRARHDADLDGADGRAADAEAVQPAHRPVRKQPDITSNTYFDWMLDHAFLFVPAQAFVAEHLQTLVEFPPRQEPASFSIDKVLAKLEAGITSS